MITRKNYELYFIDYLEGNLSNKEITMVEIFLNQNPDLKEELAEFSESEPLILDQPKKDFSFLKKSQFINESNEEEYFIGKIEGDLTKEELKLLSLYLVEHPDKIAVLQSFESTKLISGSVQFPNKHRLRKTRKIGLYYYITSAIAASVLALLVFDFYFQKDIEIPLTAKKKEYAIELKSRQNDKVKFEKLAQVVVKEEQQVKKVDLRQSESDVTVIVNDKIELEKVSSKIIELESEKVKRLELLASIPVQEALSKETEKSKTVLEFVKEKTINYLKEKTTGNKNETESLTAFLENKVKEIPLPSFIEYEQHKEDKQLVRVVKIGEYFSMKRKKRK